MTTEIVSPVVFKWILTFLVVGVCAPWLLYDLRNLKRALADDGRDPVVRDRRFGYVMGIVIAIVGILGSLKFQGVF